MENLFENHKVLKDLVYSNQNPKEQSLDLYLPLLNLDSDQSNFPSELFIYIHGGAWRTGDKSNEFSIGLIKNLSTQFAGSAIGSINYRLSRADESSTVIHHPTHNEDSTRAIEYLLKLPQLDQVKSICIIGHSVGAFIGLSISNILRSPLGGPNLSSSLSKIDGLILLDGIYGLVDLLEEYPAYKGFVEGAMGSLDRDYLEKVSPLYWKRLSESCLSDPKILIIHSRQDTLLTTLQSELLFRNLRESDVVKRLEFDYDSVPGDHDPLLKSPDLVSRIKKFLSDEPQ